MNQLSDSKNHLASVSFFEIFTKSNIFRLQQQDSNLKTRDLSENSIRNKGTNFEEFQNKMNGFKMRYGLMKDDKDNLQKQTSTSPLGSYSGGKSFTSAGTNPALSTSFDSKSATIGGGSSGTQTENIKQKLNEMKLKMNGIVNRKNTDG